MGLYLSDAKLGEQKYAVVMANARLARRSVLYFFSRQARRSGWILCCMN